LTSFERLFRPRRGAYSVRNPDKFRLTGPVKSVVSQAHDRVEPRTAKEVLRLGEIAGLVSGASEVRNRVGGRDLGLLLFAVNDRDQQIRIGRNRDSRIHACNVLRDLLAGSRIKACQVEVLDNVALLGTTMSKLSLYA
jgi:hypothetical protein